MGVGVDQVDAAGEGEAIGSRCGELVCAATTLGCGALGGFDGEVPETGFPA
jgi:hypothetical protein